jgi:hypothetical protein
MIVQELFDLATSTFGVEQGNRRFNTDFYRSLNTAETSIANKRGWGFLLAKDSVTTTASTRNVSLPSDFGRFAIDSFGDDTGQLRITGDDGGTVKVSRASDYIRNDYDEDEEGTPETAYIIGTDIYFSPIPDDAYTVEFFYYKQPEKLTESSDTINIPDRYSELLENMVYRNLQTKGYSSVTELKITDEMVRRLLYEAIKDDIALYGGATFNLASNEYTRNTV